MRITGRAAIPPNDPFRPRRLHSRFIAANRGVMRHGLSTGARLELDPPARPGAGQGAGRERRLPDDDENRAIVRAVLSMADSLGLSVTAEGVETLEQAQALKNMDCDMLQGFFFSNPVPAGHIPVLLTKRWSLSGPMLSRAVALG